MRSSAEASNISHSDRAAALRFSKDSALRLSLSKESAALRDSKNSAALRDSIENPIPADSPH